MSTELYIELIKLIPSILWLVIAVVVIIVFYKPIKRDLLPNLAGFKFMDVELSFIGDSIDDAMVLAEKSPNYSQWRVEISASDKKRAINRAKKNLEVFRDAKILWVDDYPESCINERKMFHKLGAEIDTAKNTDEALEILKKSTNSKESVYDIIISDMARGSEPTAGLDLLNRLREFNDTVPVIFYVFLLQADKGIPNRAFGITNRIDELLHLVLDVLERKYN
ncbi:MAG: response regulator [candidate division Zixibacteria bacterium]|nr:response regulator [candidate division Zixibacteria bacterium]